MHIQRKPQWPTYTGLSSYNRINWGPDILYLESHMEFQMKIEHRTPEMQSHQTLRHAVSCLLSHLVGDLIFAFWYLPPIVTLSSTYTTLSLNHLLTNDRHLTFYVHFYLLTCSLSVFLPLKCKLHIRKVFVLLTTVSSVPLPVSGT